MLIGYALCGSFCTIARSIRVMESLANDGYGLVPIMSECAYTTDTRFGKAADIRERIEKICAREIIHTVKDAEPLGPDIHLDMLVVAPCTGNTLAKLSRGITDGAVTMACKAHLRSDRPLILALATNDALSANLENIARMLKRRSVYFTPMLQDDVTRKPHSLVAELEMIPDAIRAASEGRQLRPIFLQGKF